MKKNKQFFVTEDQDISDGYHTFSELYEYRKMYNALLFNEWAKQGKYDVHKSFKHHDGQPCFDGKWFIVVAILPTGQITNHYKLKDWDLFQIPFFETAKYKYDGHTPKDVKNRMLKLLQKNLYEINQNPKIYFNGSILHDDGRTMIMKGDENKYHALYFSKFNNLILDSSYTSWEEINNLFQSFNLRTATEKEKQQLFDALARENKRWNSKTLQIEDIVDFSILNVKDIFYIKSSHEWLIKGGYIRKDGFLITNNKIIQLDENLKDINGMWVSECIKEMRLATEKEKELYYNEYPELAPIKVDFSILNDEDWFVIVLTSYKWLLKGGRIEGTSIFDFKMSYSYASDRLDYDEDLPVKSGFDLKKITTLRKATPEDLKPLFEKHPELVPPKVGDWGIFYDYLGDKHKYIIAELNHIYNENKIDIYEVVTGCVTYQFKHFHKINPEKPLQPQINKFLKSTE